MSDSKIEMKKALARETFNLARTIAIALCVLVLVCYTAFSVYAYVKFRNTAFLPVLFLVFLFGVLIYGVRFWRSHRTMKNLSDDEAEQLTRELALATRYPSLKILVTGNYLVSTGTGYLILPIEEIGQVYKIKHSVNFIPTNVSLNLRTGNNQSFQAGYASFYSPSSKKKQDELIMLLYERNPRILVGYTNEALYAYNQRIAQRSIPGWGKKR